MVKIQLNDSIKPHDENTRWHHQRQSRPLPSIMQVADMEHAGEISTFRQVNLESSNDGWTLAGERTSIGKTVRTFQDLSANLGIKIEASLAATFLRIFICSPKTSNKTSTPQKPRTKKNDSTIETCGARLLVVSSSLSAPRCNCGTFRVNLQMAVEAWEAVFNEGKLRLFQKMVVMFGYFYWRWSDSWRSIIFQM